MNLSNKDDRLIMFMRHVCIDDVNDCWLWKGARTRGYGTFHSAKGTMPAHRWIYEKLVDFIPESLVIDHLCRIPLCVNPDHMEPVTHKENTLRGISPSARNKRKMHCIYGHKLDGNNLSIIHRSDGRVERRCKKCHVKRNMKHEHNRLNQNT